VGSIRRALLTVAAAAIPVVAHAQTSPASAAQSESNLTVYGGYRFGGGFTDVNTGKTWELTEGPAFSVAADFGIDRHTQWEVFAGYRNSSLKASGFAPVANDIGLGVTYLHVGGTYFAEQVGKGVYGVGGLGVTNFDPRPSDLSSETRFSLNLGFGYMIPVGKYVAVKLEGRGFVTLIDSSGGFFCSGGCVVQVKGSTFTQAELMAGISARF
jgi:hypothetical protein